MNLSINQSCEGMNDECESVNQTKPQPVPKKSIFNDFHAHATNDVIAGTNFTKCYVVYSNLKTRFSLKR